MEALFSNRKKLPKIVVVAEELDCLGGVQKFVDLLARGLSGRGYEVELIGLYESAVQFPYDRTLIQGVRYLKPDMTETREILACDKATEAEKAMARQRSAEISAAGSAELFRYVQELNPSTIIVAVQIAALKALASSGAILPEGPKIVAQFHGSYDYAKHQHYFQEILDLFPLTEKSLFLTAADARYFHHSGVTNAMVMPNFYSRPPGLNPHSLHLDRVVVSLSRYSPEKSLHELVEAWGMLHQVFPEWRLKLYGDGPEATRINAQILELGVSESVSLEGSVPDSAHVLEGACIHAMTSHQEGFSMALMEASAMKVPSVAFYAGPSTNALIEHGKSGFVVDKICPRAFAEHLSTLMADDDLRASFGQRSFTLSRKYQEHTVLDRWEDLFQSMSG